MRRIKSPILLAVFLSFLAIFIIPTKALAVVQSLNSQTGQTQTFSNDPNVTISSSGNVHSLGWQGLLPLSRGGTGASSFTTGSLLFSNGTSITQDNANLFWDDTNNRLGIGTTTPSATKLHIYSDANVDDQLVLESSVPTTQVVEWLKNGGGNYLIGIESGDTDGGVLSSNGSSLPYAFSLVTEDARPIQFLTNSMSRMNIDGTGLISFLGITKFSSRKIATVSVNNGGTGYTANDILTLSLPNGNATVKVDSVTGGVINSITLVTPGTGYTAGTTSGVIGGTGNNDATINIDTLVGAILDISSLTTSDKIFTFPNISGTFGLLEADQTWNGLNKFEASTNSTIYVGSSVKSGCIAMGDSDGSGVTYVTANDGVLTASSTKPSFCQ